MNIFIVEGFNYYDFVKNFHEMECTNTLNGGDILEIKFSIGDDLGVEICMGTRQLLKSVPYDFDDEIKDETFYRAKVKNLENVCQTQQKIIAMNRMVFDVMPDILRVASFLSLKYHTRYNKLIFNTDEIEL